MVSRNGHRAARASASAGRGTDASGRHATDWDRPGRRVEIDRTALVLLGRTGDGRYAFARPRTEPGPERSKIIHMSVLQARLALGSVPPSGRTGDRRGNWTARG